ncbi:hypothetical protein [Paenibacillus silviterrae]|uniref:hypothetical protein n=1 Tax=Paenibacillus silviterrae TaxID=3242194 RepID=UPI002543E14E|nr:hypothetical protein [Paenibacillus chinjuensis]
MKLKEQCCVNPEQQKEAVVDTYIEDYEEFVEEDDRWRPSPVGNSGRQKDRRHAVKPPEQGRKR